MTGRGGIGDRHRPHRSPCRDQIRIRAGFTTDFLDAWSLLNVFRLDATTAAWLTVGEQLVTAWRRTSAQTAADYYTEYRAAELAGADRDRPPPVDLVLDDTADPAALRTSLLVAGPITTKRLSGQGVPVSEAARTAAVRAEAATARHVGRWARHPSVGDRR